MVNITQVTKIEIGASSGDHEDITNVKRIIPGTRARHTPRTVLSTVNAIGWTRPHKWQTFDIHVLGDVYHVIYHNGSGNVAYDKFSADNPEIPYVKFFLKDENGSEYTVSLTGAIIDYVQDGINDGEDMVTVIALSSRVRTALTPS